MCRVLLIDHSKNFCNASFIFPPFPQTVLMAIGLTHAPKSSPIHLCATLKKENVVLRVSKSILAQRVRTD